MKVERLWVKVVRCLHMHDEMVRVCRQCPDVVFRLIGRALISLC